MLAPVTRGARIRFAAHDAFIVNAIEQSVADDEHSRRLESASSGTMRATLGERRQAVSSVERFVEDREDSTGGGHGDHVEYFLQSEAGGFRPDYGSRPMSHFRRNSAATWAWGITRPAALSASPRSTAWAT